MLPSRHYDAFNHSLTQLALQPVEVSHITVIPPDAAPLVPHMNVPG